jgi:chemotaxis methyl-accepting protein methylase
MAFALSTFDMTASPDMTGAGIDDQEFALWVELLGRRIGLRDSLIRKSFLTQCVATRMRQRGVKSRRAYFDLLRANKGNEDEWDHLIHLLPLHETRFFRHDASLKLVDEHLRKRCGASRERPNALNIWSVGCSTGEEVYSLSMVANDALKACDPRPRWCVIGSDVSRTSLEIARRGRYHRRQLSNLDANALERNFDRIDDGTHAVKPELREHVQFVSFNLYELRTEAGVMGPMDVVFCQNVLIYFDNHDRELIVARLAEHLVPGGLLVLGAGELMHRNLPRLKRVNTDDTLAFEKLSNAI